MLDSRQTGQVSWAKNRGQENNMAEELSISLGKVSQNGTSNDRKGNPANHCFSDQEHHPLRVDAIPLGVCEKELVREKKELREMRGASPAYGDPID